MRQAGFFIILIFLIINARSYADEVLVGIDEQGKTRYIDSELEKKIKLFPDYKKFIEARIYKIDEKNYSLEILYYNEKNIETRKRTLLDEQDYQKFRKKVTERSAKIKIQKELDQEGRYKFLTATTIYSLAFYGPMTSFILDIDETKNFVALQCAMGSAGFFLPFWLTHDRQVTEASASSYIYGGLGGMFHGFNLRLIFFGESDISERISSSLVLGTSLAEGIGGFYISERYNYSPGRVDNIASGFFWGTAWAFEIMYIASEMENARASGAVLFAGSLAGTGLGYFMSNTEDYSRGDVVVQNSVTLLGAYVPLAIVDLTKTDNEKIFIASSLSGSILGAALGYYLIKDKDFSTGQGGLISLGEFAGGLLGVGTAYYFSEGNRALYLTCSSIGSMAGLAILYYIFHDEAIFPDNNSSWDIRFFPMNIAQIFSEKALVYNKGNKNFSFLDSIPIASIAYRF